MFKVWLTNLGWFAKNGQQFRSLRAAVAVGKSLGFEFTVQDEFGAVVSWSPIGGLREYRALTADGELRQDSPR